MHHCCLVPLICILSQFSTLLLGYYMYIETSRPRRQGDKATLQSQNIPNANYCFKYWYNMNGASVGSLSVSYMYSDGTKKTLKSLNGSQGANWQQGMVSINDAFQDFTVSAYVCVSNTLLF